MGATRHARHAVRGGRAGRAPCADRVHHVAYARAACHGSRRSPRRREEVRDEATGPLLLVNARAARSDFATDWLPPAPDPRGGMGEEACRRPDLAGRVLPPPGEPAPPAMVSAEHGFGREHIREVLTRRRETEGGGLGRGCAAGKSSCKRFYIDLTC